MSQANVERIVGRLVTDEDFRVRFTWTPNASSVASSTGAAI